LNGENTENPAEGKNKTGIIYPLARRFAGLHDPKIIFPVSPARFIFEVMRMKDRDLIELERFELRSSFLRRTVYVDIYQHTDSSVTERPALLLVNDGQDLPKFNFLSQLNQLTASGEIAALTCVGIHCGAERKMEYGIARQADFKGRGALAGEYTRFILEELYPFLGDKTPQTDFSRAAFAGFSLGGLSALDIVWNHPSMFNTAAVFSGSLWWRSIDQSDKQYDDDKHRIMHQQIRQGGYKTGLKFFFQCGHKDETRDRNQNGIIDSIDDTLDLIHELEQKGYSADIDLHYLEMPNGLHDVPTWGKAMPEFLKWAWGKKPVSPEK
jgi:enterochelin esterase-like enzyme